MNKPDTKYCDGVFIITEERGCPVYNTGEELKVQDFCLSITSYKPGCLHLSRKIAEILTVSDNDSAFPRNAGPKTKFDCGGCEGIIHFEHKKEKDFATLQMKMLQEAEDRRNRHLIEKHFEKLRKLPLFRTLDDHALVDLTLLFEFKTILQNKRVVKKGASGNHLYIILKGKVAVIEDDGSHGVEINAGEIFGEMSLLSGEPVSKSIHTTEDTDVAMLSLKNFRDILRGFHQLQFFLLTLLVERSQSIALRSGEITSGMTGQLSEIEPVKLFTLMNSKNKTGGLHFSLKQGKAVLFFKKGEIIYARYQKHRQIQAVYQLLATQKGHFRYTRGIPNELRNAPAIESFEDLIYDGMQIVRDRQNKI